MAITVSISVFQTRADNSLENLSNFVLSTLINKAARRLEKSEPGLVITAELLKAKVQDKIQEVSQNSSPMAPIFEVLIAEPEFAATCGVEITKFDIGRKSERRMVDFLKTQAKSGGTPALHSTSEACYVFTYRTEPNLIKTIVQLRMEEQQRVQNAPGSIKF